ncbi:MAG: ROK family transcriptional regulator [Anaerolineales bacterium]|nr:ROK family transcriptional regulator [Anaerolineales bacterium]
MKFTKTITTNDLRHINRTAVLDLLRREGPISRTELSQRLEISLPTVMRIVEELLEEKLLRTVDHKEWSGGRRRALVEFNAHAHLAIGVDCGGTKMFGALADLSGEIIEEINVPTNSTCGDKNFELLVEIITQLVKKATTTDKNLLGVGVGIPATVDVDRGIVLSSPALGWREFPLQERLKKEFDIPVVLDNDVNLAALGEMWFGSKQAINNLALITVGTGIGAGIIIDGAVYRGSKGSAGEVGFLLPSTAHLGQGRSHQGFGPLETLASGTGIAERARTILTGTLSEEQLNAITAEDVFDKARQKEPWAVQIVDETVDLLALAVVTLAVCYDPDVIVLGGGVARSADLLIEPIKQRVSASTPFPFNLVASPLGYRAAVMGSIVNLVYRAANFYMLRKLS